MCFYKPLCVRSDRLAQEMTDDEECRVKDRRKRRGRGAGVALISEMGERLALALVQGGTQALADAPS